MERTLSDDLQSLAAAPPGDIKRSKTARLRAVLPDIETALQSGIPHGAILETLKRHGLDMSISTFSTTLQRLRKETKEGRAP